LAVHEDDAQKEVDEIKKEALDDVCEADNENIKDGQNSGKNIKLELDENIDFPANETVSHLTCLNDQENILVKPLDTGGTVYDEVIEKSLKRAGHHNKLFQIKPSLHLFMKKED
jgi:hypothetical protein